MEIILVWRFKMKVIVDRIVDNFLVVELPDKSLGQISLSLVPNVKEGDVIELNILKKDTNDRKVSIEKLMNDVFK